MSSFSRVDAANGNDGTGSFANGLPFQTIQAAVAAAPTNADIVVRRPLTIASYVVLESPSMLVESGSLLSGKEVALTVRTLLR